MHEPRRFSGNLDCSDPVVTIADRWAGYNRRPALEEVNFCLPRGSLVGVVGPNGGGKSTFLKVILGLVSPWRGTVSILGKRPREGRHLLGYVPQREDVDWRFPVNALDVVLMGTYGRIGLVRRPGKGEAEFALHCLARVGLADNARRQIVELSGGQQQRVFIARALAQKPQALLLDEPVSGVDAVSQHAIFELLEALCEQGVAVLATSHDLSCVAGRFQRAVCLNRRIVAYGAPEDVFTTDILSETYESHFLTVKAGNTSYVVGSELLNR
ncbi:MAG: metal ABC transporter ATP-binding protein [Chloroflexi bacterium]|nr:metal ABC transporter ATP-binding protein [Chloroflexota bacterium]